MMRKLVNIFKKLNKNSGFTMVELIITIVIISIVAGITIPISVNVWTKYKFATLDDTAREIFAVAQNKMSLMDISGELDSFHKSVSAASDSNAGSSGKKFPLENASEITAKNPDAPTEAEIFYIKSSSPLMGSLVSLSEIQVDGEYVIEYNPETAMVYDVFYCDNGKFSYTDFDLLKYNNTPVAHDTTTDPANLSMASRIKNRAFFGYYKGGDVEREDQERDEIAYNFDADIVNNDELYIRVFCDVTILTAEERKEAEEALKEYFLAIGIVGDTSNSEYTYTDPRGNITPGSDNTTGFKENTLSNNKVTLLEAVTEDGKTIIYRKFLLDSLGEGSRFYDFFVKNRVGEDKKFKPGEDITISLVASTDSDSLVKTLKTNSLFDRIDSEGTDNTKVNTAYIKYGRHLQNLHPNWSDPDKTYKNTSAQGNLNIATPDAVNGITAAVVEQDILWNRDYIFRPVSNTNLNTVKGEINGSYNNPKIVNIQIKEDENANQGSVPIITKISDYRPIGLFGLFTGSEISGLDLVNIAITNPTEQENLATHVGTLAGLVWSNNGTKISDCHVYADSSPLINGVVQQETDITEDSCCIVFDETNGNKLEAVGGLVGSVLSSNKTAIINTIDHCSASTTTIKVATHAGQTTYVGGFIGHLQSCAITKSYAESGIKKDEVWSGGLNVTTGNNTDKATVSGFAGSYYSKNSITDCYVVGYSNNDIDAFCLGESAGSTTGHTCDTANSYAAVVTSINGVDSYIPCSSFGNISSTVNCYILTTTGNAAAGVNNNGITPITYYALSEAADLLGSSWSNSKNTETYGIANVARARVFYPFPVQKDGQTYGTHYGDWPSPDEQDVEPLYYEIYLDSSSSTGYSIAFYNEEQGLDKLNDDLPLVQEGYALAFKTEDGTFKSYSGADFKNPEKLSITYTNTAEVVKTENTLKEFSDLVNSSGGKIQVQYQGNVFDDNSLLTIGNKNYYVRFLGVQNYAQTPMRSLAQDLYREITVNIVNKSGNDIRTTPAVTFYVNTDFAKSKFYRGSKPSPAEEAVFYIRSERHFATLNSTSTNRNVGARTAYFNMSNYTYRMERDLEWRVSDAAETANVPINYNINPFGVNLDGPATTWISGLGNDNNPFSGTFDGNGHYIKGTVLNDIGFVAIASDTTHIKNLEFRECIIRQSFINSGLTSQNYTVNGGLYEDITFTRCKFRPKNGYAIPCFAAYIGDNAVIKNITFDNCNTQDNNAYPYSFLSYKMTGGNVDGVNITNCTLDAGGRNPSSFCIAELCGGQLSNVNIKNNTYKNGITVGALAGKLNQTADVTLNNITIEGNSFTVNNSVGGQKHIGLLFGQINGTTGNTTYNSVTISGTNTINVVPQNNFVAVGNIVGTYYSDKNWTMPYIEAEGSVTNVNLTAPGNFNKDFYVGGAVGMIGGNSTSMTAVEGLKGTINVTSNTTQTYTGGLIGRNLSNVSVNGGLSYVNINTSNGYAGGFVGKPENATYTNCRAAGSVSGSTTLPLGGFTGVYSTGSADANIAYEDMALLADLLHTVKSTTRNNLVSGITIPAAYQATYQTTVNEYTNANTLYAAWISTLNDSNATQETKDAAYVAWKSAWENISYFPVETVFVDTYSSMPLLESCTNTTDFNSTTLGLPEQTIGWNTTDFTRTAGATGSYSWNIENLIHGYLNTLNADLVNAQNAGDTARANEIQLQINRYSRLYTDSTWIIRGNYIHYRRGLTTAAGKVDYVYRLNWVDHLAGKNITETYRGCGPLTCAVPKTDFGVSYYSLDDNFFNQPNAIGFSGWALPSYNFNQTSQYVNCSFEYNASKNVDDGKNHRDYSRIVEAYNQQDGVAGITRISN